MAHIHDMVNALVQDNKVEAEGAFKADMANKIGYALDQKRVEVANSLVKQHVPTVPDEEEV
tara:strand:- start:394 stop:576 length:183 start_codon:yes stop_codon:yes gene_type:complete